MLSTPFFVKNLINEEEGIAVSEHFTVEEINLPNGGSNRVPVHFFTVLYYNKQAPELVLASEIEWLEVPGMTDDDSESDDSDDDSESDDTDDDSESDDSDDDSEDETESDDAEGIEQ